MDAPYTLIRSDVVVSRLWPITVWAGAALYAVLLTLESIADHQAFRTGFDTAIADQQLWLLANGHEPFSTITTRSLLAIHFHPSIVIFTPLYWLGLGISGMFAAQSIALGLTAPALYALARECGASAPLAAIPSLLWLACPWVASVNLFEWRPDPFAPVLIVLSVLFALRRRYVLLALTVVLALSLKEDIGLTYVALGVVLAYHGRRGLGACLSLVGAVWVIGASLAMNALGSGSHQAFSQRWAGDRGNSVGSALLWCLQHPLETLTEVASASLLPVVALVVSSGGLGLLAPSWLLLAAPTTGYNVLSDYGPQHDLVHHYHLGTLVGLFVAAAVGVSRLPALGTRARWAVASTIAVAGLVALFGGARVHSLHGDAVRLDAEPTTRALERIPAHLPVAATRTLLPHLSSRSEVWTLPEPFVPIDWGGSLTRSELRERASRVNYVAYAAGDQIGTVYTGDIATTRAIPDIRPQLEKEGFVVIARVGTVEILRRGGPG